MLKFLNGLDLTLWQLCAFASTVASGTSQDFDKPTTRRDFANSPMSRMSSSLSPSFPFDSPASQLQLTAAGCRAEHRDILTNSARIRMSPHPRTRSVSQGGPKKFMLPSKAASVSEESTTGVVERMEPYYLRGLGRSGDARGPKSENQQPEC